LTAGADVNAQTGSDLPIEIQIQQEHLCPNGLTALSEAALRGHHAVVRMLLDAGADVGAQSKALGNAAAHGRTEVVRILLDAGHEIDIKDVLGGTALSKAAMMGHAEIVRILLDSGANIGAQSEALSQAALHGNQEIARMLLDAGHDIEARYSLLGHTPLESAAWAGHNMIVRMLLDAGADINAQGQRGDAQNIPPGADPNAPAMTALMLAVASGHDDTVRLLLDEGADIEAKSYFGTALGVAASKSHLEILNILLAAGADVNAQDVRGRTALSMTRNPKVISILYEAGADLKKMSVSLIWDLAAMIPVFVSILLGIILLYQDRDYLRKSEIDLKHVYSPKSAKRFFSFYFVNTTAFSAAFIGLILFPYSLFLLYTTVILLGIASISAFVSWFATPYFVKRNSWRPVLLFLGGGTCLLVASVLWYLNHAVEIMFS
jgi:ankyrin repeat protein